jgi:putative DNA primase/helicase
VGERACSSVPILKFGERFGKSALLRSSVNLVDENPVGAFATDVSDWKAAITGDVLDLERKYKDPLQMRWRGFEVQCLNTMTPKMKDKSASLKRRLLIVPMTKSFEGIERKYIKNDYLGRDDVLRYVMRRALQMQHIELSEPLVCRIALNEWYRANNKVVDFWQEFEGEFVWDLLPFSFLYDLFVAWSRRREPSGTPEGYRTFSAELKTYLGRSEDWAVPEVSVRPKTMMSASEPLIGIWDLKEWQNSTYTSNDPHRLGAFDKPAANYKGAVRRVPIGAGNSAVSPAENPAEA